MKHVLQVLALAAIALLVQTGAKSQEKGFGIGIIIGEPTGISMKGWVSQTNAIDGGLAWSFAHETSFHIHADYLWHAFHVFKTTETIPLYYGIGGRIKTGRHEDPRIGVRVVGGIEYIFKNAPVDLFLEFAPIVDLAPSTDLDGNAGFGVRFYF